MNINTDLKDYLEDNLDPACYTLIRRPYNEAHRISILAEISICKLSDNVLCLVMSFLKNLSREVISEYINRTDDMGRNIFFVCANIELLKFMIEYVHDINACGDNGINALANICGRRGISSDEVEIIELLLNYGADPNAPSINGYTSLMNYCSISSPTSHRPNNNFERVVELLISRGACVSTTSYAAKMRALDFVSSTSLLSEELLQLLRGEVSMRQIKSAAKV